MLSIIGVFYNIPLNRNYYALQQIDLENQEFLNFISNYNKDYKTPEEYKTRLGIFLTNLAYIKFHNSLGNSYLLGVNQFSDLTHEEFQRFMTPIKYEIITEENQEQEASYGDIPQQVDWRTKGAVTPVKNQLQCACGWAFAATGAIEGIWFINNNKLLSLSEQELLDCSTSFGTNGCSGGLASQAFKFVIANGITSETNYPYKGVKGKCNTSKQSQSLAKITSYETVPPNSPNSLMAIVAQWPVTVVVESNQAAWQFYRTGIITDNCGVNLDNSVLIVGYDNTNNPPYWIVKNSWGASWGENGYIRIAISSGSGICGINMVPTYTIY
mmetsp:Transcript_3837/g.3630  ORF Transcript_3837/g.3630 Transcript_3837/m.3630 type:complete len:327 (+) Transcript_3837:194-1174(+)